MVGVLVIGIIGGVIAAVVFMVIPWAQDRAAMANLDAVNTAESVTYAQSAGDGDSRYEVLAGLVASGLIQSVPTVAVAISADASCYVAASASETSNVYLSTNASQETTPYTPGVNVGCLSVSQVESLVESLFPDTSSFLVMKIDTSISTCTVFTLPIRRDFTSSVPTNFTVDWGDGSASQTVTSDSAPHTYAVPGPHTITVNGTFGRLGTTGTGAGSTECLTSVDRWGSGTKTTSAERAFYKSAVTTVAAPPPSISNMNHMFRDASKFNGDVSRWNTSKVVDMTYMFSGATVFNGDLSRWDTGQVTNMNFLFYKSSAFNGDVSRWNTSKVTSMAWMFHSATVFNGDLSRWDTSNVRDMNNMFKSATAFRGDVGPWKTGQVTDMSYMFSEATVFNGDLSSWDTSNVTSMIYMFRSATTFNSDLSDWKTGNVTNMLGTFYQATTFNSDLSDWDTSSVTNMSLLFREARAFTSDLSGWDTSKATNMGYMFATATAFDSNLREWDTSRVVFMTSMFHMASAYTNAGQPLAGGNWSIVSVTTKAGMDLMFYNAFAFQQDLSSWAPQFVGAPTSFGFSGARAPVWR